MTRPVAWPARPRGASPCELLFVACWLLVWDLAIQRPTGQPPAAARGSCCAQTPREILNATRRFLVLCQDLKLLGTGLYHSISEMATGPNYSPPSVIDLLGRNGSASNREVENGVLPREALEHDSEALKLVLNVSLILGVKEPASTSSLFRAQLLPERKQWS